MSLIHSPSEIDFFFQTLICTSRIGGANLTEDRWVEMHFIMPNMSCPELSNYVP